MCGRHPCGRRGALFGTQVCAVAFTLALAGCAVGPDYVPAAAPVPQTFKELKGWKRAMPADHLPRGDWWAFYNDPKLNFLIKQVEISGKHRRPYFRPRRPPIRPPAPSPGQRSAPPAEPPPRGCQGPIRRLSYQPFPVPGTWMSGARCGGRSRATHRRRK
jgi:hypothetical protein